MVDSPLIILFEMVAGLLQNTIESFSFMYAKMVELFIVLGYMAGVSPLGMVVAVSIGALALFFVLKISFGSSKGLLIIFLFFFLLLLMIFIGVGSQTALSMVSMRQFSI